MVISHTFQHFESVPNFVLGNWPRFFVVEIGRHSNFNMQENCPKPSIVQSWKSFNNNDGRAIYKTTIGYIMMKTGSLVVFMKCLSCSLLYGLQRYSITAPELRVDYPGCCLRISATLIQINIALIILKKLIIRLMSIEFI